MAAIIRMPSVMAGATEATISAWLVAEGDAVAIGDPIAEIETEKATVEYGAEVAGIIGRIVLDAGRTGAIGEPIAVLLAEGESDADADAVLSGSGVGGRPDHGVTGGASEAGTPHGAVSAGTAAVVPDGISAQDASAGDAGPVAIESSPMAVEGSAGRQFASPIARKLAREHDLSLATVAGTGPNGRITRRDVAAALVSIPAQQVADHRVPDGTQQVMETGPAADIQPAARLVPHTAMRRAIARRLTESKSTVPHFYLVADCRVDALLALRADINEVGRQKLSVNDFVIKAAAVAFTAVPEANVTWTDDGMLEHDTVDISVAVASDGGLVTPVVRDVGGRSLSHISAAVADLAMRARERRLRQSELEGGSFSVSNLGMYGTVEFAAILNPPQWGILAVGAATKQPVVVGDAVAVGTVMTCTLSVDHRAVDGALAARWLAAFQSAIENPLMIVA